MGEATVQEATVGTVLDGRYRLVAPIGGGAMGTVWRAAHVGEDGEDGVVAVKLLTPEVRNRAELVERFDREATLARSIDHPAVCRLLDHGTSDDGEHYLVLELLRGQSLGERLDEGPSFTGAALLEGMIEVLGGLSAIHAAGIVHRDLKPDNIFITDTDEVKLIDFGVSKSQDNQQKLTATGEVLGTPVYMAPEQAESAKAATAASDVYAMGAILYDALSGRPPFEAPSLAMMLMAVAFEEPEPIRTIRPDVPEALASLVHSAMAKSPAARPPSAEAFSAELRVVLDAHRPELEALTLERAREDGAGTDLTTGSGSATDDETLDVVGTSNTGLVMGAIIAVIVLVAVAVLMLL